MIQALHRVDDVLRARPWAVQEGRPLRRFLDLGLLVIVFGLIYGAVMGSSRGVTGPRFWQVVFSGVKLPLLLAGTFAVSLPSFFVINTLAGLRSDFFYAVRALVAAQAGLTIILASLAPLTALWYISFSKYEAATLFNAFLFAVASISAQGLLRRYYRPLILHRPAHRWLLRAWLGIYAFVGIQMAWILRPFIGQPGVPTSFLRQEAWGNAYVQLAATIWRSLGG